jgi:hypothetical protein
MTTLTAVLAFVVIFALGGIGVRFDNLLPVFLFVFTVLSVSVFVTVYSLMQKKLKDTKERLGLAVGGKYEVLQNDGKVVKNLIFSEIYYSRRTVNGNISCRFIKASTYRGDSIYRDIVIKVDNIWKVTRLDLPEEELLVDK